MLVDIVFDMLVGLVFNMLVDIVFDMLFDIVFDMLVVPHRSFSLSPCEGMNEKPIGFFSSVHNEPLGSLTEEMS